MTPFQEDPKIYSQRDMDDMFAKWQKEKVDPLLAEIKEQSLGDARFDACESS